MIASWYRRVGIAIALSGLCVAAPSAFAQTVLTNQHVDIGAGFDLGVWDLHLHDEDNDVEYEADEAVLSIGESAIRPRPAGSQFDFIGVGAGQLFHLNPQIQEPDLLLLGFGAEEIANGTFATYTPNDLRVPGAGEWIRFDLLSVTGAGGSAAPGFFSVWANGVSPIVYFSTFDGISSADALHVLPGELGHQDANFGFSVPGTYEVTLRTTAFLGPGATNPTSSDPTTYTFVVSAAAPEPGTLALLTLGGAVTLAARRRKSTANQANKA
jgi:surface-anchored protein